MFFGRTPEIRTMEERLASRQAELVVIYGRRRIGKSELLKNFVKHKKHLYFEALEKGGQKEQIRHFLFQLSEQIKEPRYEANSWREVFEILTPLIQEENWVVVFDEFPWMASKKTKLVSLLKFYWDQKWKSNSRLMLILCGSVASFMVKHIIHSQALHNRKTLEMRLDHLPLSDIRLFFKNRSLHEIAQTAMLVGGVPKYLEMWNRHQSVKVNLNNLFFKRDGFFVNELETLFKEQFQALKYYEAIVRALSLQGLSLTQIGEAVSFASGGALKKYLSNLEMAGFIREEKSVSFTGKVRDKTRKYCLDDPFLRSYFRLIEPHRQKIQRNLKGDLAESILGEVMNSFFGQAFDWLVYRSLDKLLDLLGIPLGDIKDYGPYFRQNPRGKLKKVGVQIDLVLIRKDHCVTLIENKFSQNKIGSSILDEVQNKIDALHLPKHFSVEKVLIAANGTTEGVLSAGYFDRVFTLEDLF